MMMDISEKPTVYLICGQIGAGKTTFAKKLEQETGAIRFTPDEWMLKLYPVMPPKEKFDEYFFRCCDVVWSIASEILRRGGDVIFDFGFWRYKDREQYRMSASDIGAESKIYYVVCNNDEILTRLRIRNNNRPEGSIEITGEMFDFYSPGFEAPRECEEYKLIENNC